jgi:hypothetical protein
MEKLNFSTLNTVFAGCDAGNGITKVVLAVPKNTQYRFVEASIPSIVASGRMSSSAALASNESLQDKLLELISKDGQHFITALDMSVPAAAIDALPTGGDVYQSSLARGALVYSSILKALNGILDTDLASKGLTCYLAVTTMASNYWLDNGLRKNTTRIAEVAAALGSTFTTPLPNVTIDIVRTEVFGETLAAMLSLLIDPRGNTTSPYPDESQIAVIDVGHTDSVLLVAEIKNGLPKIVKRRSIPMGIGSAVLDVVANHLSNILGRTISADLHLLSKPSLRYCGQNIDLLSVQREAVQALSLRLLAHISKELGKGAELEATYLVGGFPQVALKLFGYSYFTGYGRIHNLKVPELPVYANARGALYGLMQRIARG